MDIDLAVLRGIERERGISLDVLVRAIEQALLIAYHRTAGAQQDARVELDRASGHVVVWATDTEGPEPREYDDTPDGFGRIAATTAEQVIIQRLREVEDEAVLGEFRGREGDVIGGVIQQGTDPRDRPCRPRRASRACCRTPSRCRGRATCTASACAATSSP